MNKSDLLQFDIVDGILKLRSIAGMCTTEGKTFFRLKTDSGVFACPDAGVYTQEEDTLSAIYSLGDGLEVEITWRVVAGLVERADRIINRSDQKITLYAYNAITCFEGCYAYYSQANYWVYENQGHWETLTHGARELASSGRTCRGVTPYMALRREDEGVGIAAHLMVDSDWFMRLETGHERLDHPFVILSTGPVQDALAYTLHSRECAVLSRVLFQPLKNGTPEGGAPTWQKYLLASTTQPSKVIPIEYNTWFHHFDHLEELRLLEQLDTAAEIGCEAFTVDAGWYGQLAGDWGQQVGDWREKTDGAFYGKMREFAARVREKGLLFGVWIEPERFSKTVPIVLDHPEWFLPAVGNYFYPDLSLPEVANYVLAMISEIIDRYSAGWIKIDANHTLELDPRGKAHTGYLAGLRQILSSLRIKYPDVIFECCASGGFRMEAETQRYFDVSFMSDSVNPWDVLRIGEGAALRTLPGRIMRWCCLHNAFLPMYATKKREPVVLTPRKAIWDDAELTDADFALKVCMQGQLSFSGELARLDVETKERMKKAIGFAKENRRFIQNGITHLLTPIAPIHDRRGWSAAFICDAEGLEGILYAYRLDSPEGKRTFTLPLEVREGDYEIRDYDTDQIHFVTAEAIQKHGVTVEIQERMRGLIMTFKRSTPPSS